MELLVERRMQFTMMKVWWLKTLPLPFIIKYTSLEIDSIMERGDVFINASSIPFHIVYAG